MESPESLANAIEKCFNTPITEKIIEDNRNKALETYSIGAWVENVYNVLAENR